MLSVVILVNFNHAEEIQESTNDANGICLNAATTIFTLKATAYGYTNDGIYSSQTVHLCGCLSSGI